MYINIFNQIPQSYNQYIFIEDNEKRGAQEKS